MAAIVPATLALFSGTVSGCGDDVQGPSQPPGWDDGIRVSEAYDLNPDPNIVEVNLHAALANLSFVPGQTTTAWTYNGQIPGPLIRARVGNRVIVHLTNDLPEPTTIRPGMWMFHCHILDHAEAGMMGSLMLMEP